MKMNLLVLCALFAVGQAANSSPCCFPPVFQTTLTMKIAQTIPPGGSMNVSYVSIGLWSDYSTKQNAMQYKIWGQEENIMKEINDYNKGKSYVIQNLGTSEEKCIVSDLSGHMEKDCLPDESVLIGSLFYGAGNKTLHVDRYQFLNTKSKVMFYFTVQKDYCIPVERAEIQFAEDTDALAGGAFNDFEVKITDPSVFTPPQHCTPGQHVQIPRSWGESFLL